MTQLQIDENRLRKIVREEIREGVAAITGPQFYSIDKKFYSIDKRFETIDENFENINARFDHVDKRLDNLEGDVAEVRLKLDINGKKLDAVIEEFKDQEIRITKVEKIVHKYK